MNNFAAIRNKFPLSTAYCKSSHRPFSYFHLINNKRGKRQEVEDLDLEDDSNVQIGNEGKIIST